MVVYILDYNQSSMISHRCVPLWLIRIMAPRKSRTTTDAQEMTQAAIRKLVRDSVTEALETERAEVAARDAN